MLLHRYRTYKRISSGAMAFGVIAVSASPSHAQPLSLSATTPSSQTHFIRTGIRSIATNKLPISFEPNRGQAAAGIQFVARGPAYSLALTPTEARFALLPPQIKRAANASFSRMAQTVHPASLLRMQLLGAAKNPRMTGLAPLPGKVNYLIGSDPKSWKTDIPTYRKISYTGIYPGIDLVYYGNQRQLEYDFIVAARANPSKIALKFDGAKSLKVGESGDLVVGLKDGAVRWHKPVVYQEVNGKRTTVGGRFVVRGTDRVGFALAKYDTNRPLVIDPVFAYSTYLGGNDNDSASGLALDHDGNAYITGQTSSNNFPGTSSPPGVTAGYVTKLNATGTAVIYSTYLGQAFGQAIAVDEFGQAYVAGNTSAAGLPVVNGFQSTYSGGILDGFLMKINAAGNGLNYSTYLGGNNFDFIEALALGPDGTVYLAGITRSTNFPVRNAMRATALGGQDAIVAHINTALSGSASLLYSTYFGGNADDVALGIAVDSAGRTYVAGRTASQDLPTAGAFQPTLIGQQNAFLSVLTPDGSQLSYSTFLGGNIFDSANGVAVDNARHAYIAGSTTSINFPIRNALVKDYGGNTDGFAAKFDCAATGDSSLVYSTFLGANNSDAATAIGTDVWGNAYITGYTYNTGSASNNSVFLVKLGSGGGKLLYSTTFGGANTNNPAAIAVDPLGRAVIAGVTDSPNFPATSGALRSSNSGLQDAFVSNVPTFTKFDFNGDSMPDLLFQNANDGRLVNWLLQGSQETSFNFLNPNMLSLNWKVMAGADLNGDGSTDLLLQDSNTGNLAYWLLNGATQIGVDFISPNNPGANWNIVGAADINRDGYTDILFQNSVSGDIFVWYMQGTTLIAGGYLNPKNPGSGWKVVAVGDLNRDGQADLVLQHATTGNVYVWNMHGDTLVSGGFLNPANPGANWRVAGLVDVNGDGQPELFFQNVGSFQIMYWVLNGFNQTSVSAPNPANPGTGWNLVGIN